MASFNVDTDLENLKIIITCDTFWSCTCDGNVLLSKFSGIGNDEINLLKDGYSTYYSGAITFTYGDEHCEYPQVSVAYNDFCAINTTPSYIICKDKSILYFKYDTIYDTFKFTVDSPIDRWEVHDDGGHNYFISGNNIMVVANNENDFVIKPKECDDTSRHVYVKMIRNN